MPIYTFECNKTGETAELILPLKYCDIVIIICPVHTSASEPSNLIPFNELTLKNLDSRLHIAHKIDSLPAKINHGKPTIVLKNPKTGEFRTLPSERAMVPRGFEKVELKNPFERSKVEKILAAQEYKKIEVENVYRELRVAETTRKRHDDINAKMNSMHTDYNVDPITGKVDLENPVRFMYDNKAKELLKASMKRVKKPKQIRDPNFNFTVNHYDKSNLDKDFK